jgi:di-N-acetylchitobiase
VQLTLVQLSLSFTLFVTLFSIAWGSGIDLVCEAHAHNVRVIAAVSPPLTDNQTAISEFVAATVASVTTNFYDGVTFDWESPVESYSDPVNSYYLDVIQQTTAALKAISPDYQISVCAAWSPYGIDGRFYDYKALADATDYLYQMCYDTRSQVFDQCVASANAPASLCMKGVDDYMQIGVDSRKIILGIPWYGYRYECIDPAFDPESSKTCEIAQVPFRGVNCSDAAGSEHSFGEVRALVNGNKITSPVFRDSYLNVPYFNYKDDDGKVWQFWYDDSESLGVIYRYVKDMNLGGTGPYRFDQLDLANNAEESRAMFAALREAL